MSAVAVDLGARHVVGIGEFAVSKDPGDRIVTHALVTGSAVVTAFTSLGPPG